MIQITEERGLGSARMICDSNKAENLVPAPKIVIVDVRNS